MLVSRNRMLKDAVLENLMCAHKRLAHSGGAIHIVILSKYLLRLIDKREDELIELVPEGQEHGRCEPV